MIFGYASMLVLLAQEGDVLPALLHIEKRNAAQEIAGVE